jgi:hypothetical protein
MAARQDDRLLLKGGNKGRVEDYGVEEGAEMSTSSRWSFILGS